MNSHELARILLTLPDRPVATHANGHTYSSRDDKLSHGPIQIYLGDTNYPGEQIVIGNGLPTATFARGHDKNGHVIPDNTHIVYEEPRR